MKNKIEDLRNHLFAALEGLADAGEADGDRARESDRRRRARDRRLGEGRDRSSSR
jgi:hypothetical protein